MYICRQQINRKREGASCCGRFFYLSPPRDRRVLTSSNRPVGVGSVVLSSSTVSRVWYSVCRLGSQGEWGSGSNIPQAIMVLPLQVRQFLYPTWNGMVHTARENTIICSTLDEYGDRKREGDQNHRCSTFNNQQPTNRRFCLLRARGFLLPSRPVSVPLEFFAFYFFPFPFFFLFFCGLSFGLCLASQLHYITYIHIYRFIIFL